MTTDTAAQLHVVSEGPQPNPVAVLQSGRPDVELEAVNPLRGRPRVRNLLWQEMLSPSQLVAPVLVQPDERPVGDDYPDLPMAVRLGRLAGAVMELFSVGVRAVKLFAYVTEKRPDGSAAVEPDNLLVRAVRCVREAVPDMVIATEVCGCAWTTSGECVLVDEDTDRVHLDDTYELMATMAVQHAQAGADIIGPAAVLEGSVEVIRASLDREGFRSVGLTPSVIFASSLFEPYKTAMHTDPGRGHRRGLQIDACHVGQALDCAHRWLDEGADSLLVQPAMTGVDLLARLRAETHVPITAFSVSGEHLLLCDDINLYSEYTRYLRRAGADLVMTYGARQLARSLRGQGETR